ncbi:MAG: NCS2 family permease [Rhodospirillales bacterium]|jgi:AGZA family xanthine/uracil permease-like MFS transporter|nr:guanine permease [Rhodospirillaceae bacterium]MDP6428858.1 NCS2 family permease [Rhodospirillales bacterium]MDP6643951.1 NCS2 family permease [Rhodospirillales bacterium]MDP6841078.1 NCS2 family permease [Rhodospirillales bacterium]|tara:strand:- start:277 stop:1575 length:1299 start_codon:yes stop_codon:yes gene_type:complete
MEAIARYFEIEAKGSSIRTEILAGLATFLTMAYIIVVNPAILSKAGMDFGAVFVATILAAAIGTLIMGLWAKWPVAMAPGMGLNAFFAFGVVLGMKQTWEVALGAVFLAGILFFLLSLTGLRQWIINSIPRSLKYGIGAGIGFFLAIIGLKNAGVVIDNPATLVGLGDLSSMPVLLAGLGFVGMVALDRLKVPGAIVISILVVSIIAWIFGVSDFAGIVGPMPSMAPTFLQLDIGGAFSLALIGVVFAFLFVDFFDTAGTLTSVANVAGKVDADGNIEGIGRAVISDSVATVAGAALGTSNTTSYIESGAGIKEGGRTGLTAVTTAVLFLLCLGFAPLAQSIPGFAAAPALVFVAAYFARNLKDMDWEDVSEYAPAILAAILMPLTFSIANGIAIGFISYAVIKLLSGRFGEVNPAILLVAVLGVLHYAFGT